MRSHQPLRTIAGPLTTLTRPSGVAVTDDAIIVCDQGTSAIDIFPINAGGNVAPTRQIVGPDTGIDLCFDVAVFNGELYVAQLHRVGLRLRDRGRRWRAVRQQWLQLARRDQRLSRQREW
jgi:hypothetical protein